MCFVKNSTPEEVQSKSKVLADLIRDEQPELVKELVHWFRNYLNSVAGKPYEEDFFIDLENVVEDNNMFATELKRYGQEIKEEGRAEGKKEEQDEVILKMKQKGMTTGEIANLLDLPLEEVAKIKG